MNSMNDCRELFFKESAKFLGMSEKEVKRIDNGRSDKFAKGMMAWEKLTPGQREAWYLSGEGRLL